MGFNSYDRSTRVALIMAIGFLLPASFAAAQTDYGGYRPHYQGHGINTPGGRGGAVCKVTSLADPYPSVPGTLRYCVEDSSGPRFVVFEISGTIRLVQGTLMVKYPYVTIAGQTAPSPGIVIRGPGVTVDTHDVVMQHVRIRVGNLAWEPHGLWLRDDARNIVIDHISVSWAVWTSIGIYPSDPSHPGGDISIIDSIVSEALACSGVNGFIPCDPRTYPGDGYSNSRAIGIGGNAEVTLLRNVSANNNDRHPETGGLTQTLIVNNLIYNPSLTPWSGIFFEDARGGGPTKSVIKNNLLIPGATTPGNNGYVALEYPEEGAVKMIRVDGTLNQGSKIYLDGNYYAKDCRGTACLASPSEQWMLADDWAGPSVHASSPPISVSSLPLSSALSYSDVERFAIANAGARPLDRDVVDERVIHEIATRTGSVPNRTSEKAGAGTSADGFPILAENRRTLTVPSNPNATVDSVGRTRIEEWLETFARALEPANQGAASGSAGTGDTGDTGGTTTPPPTPTPTRRGRR